MGEGVIAATRLASRRHVNTCSNGLRACKTDDATVAREVHRPSCGESLRTGFITEKGEVICGLSVRDDVQQAEKLTMDAPASGLMA